jgi:murein DD-endopeptidase MepM/ murein hydrolase activator NlpD
MSQPTSAIGALTPGAPQRGAAENPARVRELAHEFEAMFLAQMLKQMRQSMAFADDQDGEGFGKAAFADTFDTELARHLSASGGIGIAAVIMESFDRRGPAAAGVDVAPAPTGPMALPGPVSSGFGWRQDPLTGQNRFHKGVDIKAAYGQDVPSVAGGRVVAAGDHGGYGLTVVVEHDSGIRTRYAHLSALAVQPGDEVAPGQHLGRVGSTGRSTGAHLHFEVLEDGRAVDPTAGLQKLAENAAFKKVRAVADSSISRVSGSPERGGLTDED